jgi:hypothetical protein
MHGVKRRDFLIAAGALLATSLAAKAMFRLLRPQSEGV